MEYTFTQTCRSGTLSAMKAHLLCSSNFSTTCKRNFILISLLFRSFRSAAIGIGHSITFRRFPENWNRPRKPPRGAFTNGARENQGAGDFRPIGPARWRRFHCDLRRLQPAMTDGVSPALSAPPGDYLERSEEGVDVGFIGGRQAVEQGGHISRLPGVTLDCVKVGKREAIMHHAVACA